MFNIFNGNKVEGHYSILAASILKVNDEKC